MKIGLIQMNPALGDTAANIVKIDKFLGETKDADLVVLPELCHCGYNFSSKQQAIDTSESVTDSRYIDFLSERCRQHRQHLVSGLNERVGDDLYNSAVLVGPEGVRGIYRKLHLFYNEKDLFIPGNAGLPVFDIGICKVGLLICFDWIFPEVWRALALKGADIICHPSNLVIPGLCQRAVPVHAVTNRVFVVTANRIGTEGDLTFTGLSTIAGPKAEILYQASADREETKTLAIDIARARDKYVTSRNHIFDDRRPEEYAAITETRPKEKRRIT
ncbi:MAG: nitrilase-related carbon-nitrogen hydrolase [Candidatus Zixiibacteriota bacterium]